MNFNAHLDSLPMIDHLSGLNVLDGQTLIHHIPAQAGKRGSLRVYYALAQQFNGKLDRTSAQKGYNSLPSIRPMPNNTPADTRILISCFA